MGRCSFFIWLYFFFFYHNSLSGLCVCSSVCVCLFHGCVYVHHMYMSPCLRVHMLTSEYFYYGFMKSVHVSLTVHTLMHASVFVCVSVSRVILKSYSPAIIYLIMWSKGQKFSLSSSLRSNEKGTDYENNPLPLPPSHIGSKWEGLDFSVPCSVSCADCASGWEVWLKIETEMANTSKLDRDD